MIRMSRAAHQVPVIGGGSGGASGRSAPVTHLEFVDGWRKHLLPVDHQRKLISSWRLSLVLDFCTVWQRPTSRKSWQPNAVCCICRLQHRLSCSCRWSLGCLLSAAPTVYAAYQSRTGVLGTVCGEQSGMVLGGSSGELPFVDILIFGWMNHSVISGECFGSGSGSGSLGCRSQRGWGWGMSSGGVKGGPFGARAQEQRFCKTAKKCGMLVSSLVGAA